MRNTYEMPFAEAEPLVVTTPVFSIRFAFENTIYHAEVLRKETTVMEYHISQVKPSVSFLPDPFIVASNLRRDLFDFPVNEKHYPVGFGKSIVAAIETACAAKGVSVF
ncbi:hypothetical protein [Sediminibacterium soli]|uniref:hypothetical protein n=1 Tax=Sediminibacterium soli TaxID=2698829 RepID=UPI00137B0825|nr:hypothetical protein [Sediminibacterium soli]NCI47969.1 hypothetical protein [Sediminibacterium soli]